VRRLDLFGRELLAVDGTRIKAVNIKTGTSATGRPAQKFIEAPTRSWSDLFETLDGGRRAEEARDARRFRGQEIWRKDRSAEKQSAANSSAIFPRMEDVAEARCSLTDPTAAPWRRHTKVGVGYTSRSP